MEDCLGNQVDTGGAEASQAARPFSQLWVASTYWPTSRKPTFAAADRGGERTWPPWHGFVISGLGVANDRLACVGTEIGPRGQ